MFLNSLALPKKWMFVNYATAWGKGLLFYFKNSIIVSAISILCILLLSSMLAYGLKHYGQGHKRQTEKRGLLTTNKG